MGFNSSSGTTSISGNVTSLPKKYTVTPLYFYNSGISSTGATIATVPAGKKWTIVCCSISFADAIAYSCEAVIQLDGVNSFSFGGIGASGAFYAGGISYVLPYDIAPVVGAGKLIKIHSPNLSHIPKSCTTLFYVEEDA